jgi:hypothetical protein
MVSWQEAISPKCHSHIAKKLKHAIPGGTGSSTEDRTPPERQI